MQLQRRINLRWKVGLSKLNLLEDFEKWDDYESGKQYLKIFQLFWGDRTPNTQHESQTIKKAEPGSTQYVRIQPDGSVDKIENKNMR